MSARAISLVAKAAVCFPALLVLLLSSSSPGNLGATWAADSVGRDPAQLYAAQCASCHGAGLGGGEFGPALRGVAFQAKWKGRPSELERFMRTSMPPAQPGSLGERAYGDMLQFILRQNALSEDTHAATTQAPDAGPPDERIHIGTNGSVAGAFEDNEYRRVKEEQRRLLARLTPVTEEMLRSPPEGEWLLWRGGYSNSSFSPLKQIDRTNVTHLRAIWSWSLPVAANSIAPLVHNSVMFVNSANEVQAIDAATGTLLWRYSRELPQRFNNSIYTRQRNIAIADDRIYVATADRHLVALDEHNGQLVWDREVVGMDAPSVLLPAGPLIAGDKVIQTTASGAACRDGCTIVAFDRRTGREVWRKATIAPAGTRDGDSWNGAASGKRFGGGIWIVGTYDPSLKLSYFGVGQTYNIQTLLNHRTGGRQGDARALYTDSTLAIDPDTGRVIWYHQHLARDVWDFDEAFERVLVDLPTPRGVRKLLVTTGKLGIIDILDRTTGAYVSSIDLGLQNVVRRIDRRTGARSTNPGMEPVADKPITVCPSVSGVRNWMTTAYDAASSVMYFPMLEICMDYAWLPSAKEGEKVFAGNQLEGIDVGWREKPRVGSDGLYGRIDAISLTSGQRLWSVRQRAPLSSSLLLTAGGLLFDGDRTRLFQARDARSGRILWSTRLNAVPNASPISYAVDGKQYIAVVAGGGTLIDLLTKRFTPEIENSAASTTIWVFALE